MAVNCSDKNCSCSINNYFKTFGTIINMAEPIYLVGDLREMIILTIMIDQTWTLQGLFHTVRHRNDKKKNRLIIFSFECTLLNVISLIKLFTTFCSSLIKLPILCNHFGHKIVAITLPTTLNQLVQLLTLKKETFAKYVLVFMYKHDVNREHCG